MLIFNNFRGEELYIKKKNSKACPVSKLYLFAMKKQVLQCGVFYSRWKYLVS